MFIVQFHRSNPTGLKIRRHTSYPIVLDQNTYRLACGEPMVHPFTLQAVLVHNGQEVTRGHYVAFTKLVGSPGLALCNDDKVQWVSEMEVLAQEESILIYDQPDAFQYTRTEHLADQIAATVQSGTVIHSGAAHHHSDTEASPPSGTGPHTEGVYPHLHEERGPPSTSSLSTSLPHYRSAMEDQPLKSEKCSSEDQPSDEEKINLGYAEQMNGSTHEKLDKQFQSALKQKLSRSDSTWISAATLVQ
jgi:hypothetical protein